MKHIPNMITTLNLVSGFVAIILILNGNLIAAGWFIAAAMVFDFLDGLAARLLNAYSDMGKELDSLADIVSFGVAPALIVYKLLEPGSLQSSRLDEPGNNIDFLFMAISAVYALCAGLRLAKFNTDTEQSLSFRGLPTPAAALSVISLVLAAGTGEDNIVKSFTISSTALTVYTLLISGLMVSRLPMMSLKIKNLKFKGNEAKYVLAGISLVLLISLGLTGLVLVIPVYVVISLVVSQL